MDSDSPPPDETAAGRLDGRPRLRTVPNADVDVDEDLELHNDPEVLPGGWAEHFEFEGRSKAEHERAIAADARRLMLLQLHGFDERSWGREERRLVAYALRVVPGLVLKGHLFVMMRQLEIPGAHSMALPSVGIPLAPEEAHEVANEAITKAVDPFKRILMQGRWTPDVENGAQLTSFFVGQVCWQFRGPWRSLMARRNSVRRQVALENEEAELLRRTQASDLDDPGHRVVVLDEIDDALSFIEDVVDREIVKLTAAGYNAREVANAVGLKSPRQVEYRLRKVRDRLKQLDEVRKLRERTFEVA